MRQWQVKILLISGIDIGASNRTALKYTLNVTCSDWERRNTRILLVKNESNKRPQAM